MINGLPLLSTNAKSFKEITEVVTSQMKFLYNHGLIKPISQVSESRDDQVKELEDQVAQLQKYALNLENQLHEKSL